MNITIPHTVSILTGSETAGLLLGSGQLPQSPLHVAPLQATLAGVVEHTPCLHIAQMPAELFFSNIVRG